MGALIFKGVAMLALMAMLALGITSCKEGLREQGREQVRAEWIKADMARISAERAALIEQQRAEREKEQRMAKAAEENAREQTQRDEALRVRASAAERAAAGLRRALATANVISAQQRAERGASGTCPAADAEADAAATARTLLGRCADRYRAVGARAAGLAGQVIGLQEHVLVLQPEAAALLQAAPEDNDEETP